MSTTTANPSPGACVRRVAATIAAAVSNDLALRLDVADVARQAAELTGAARL